MAETAMTLAAGLPVAGAAKPQPRDRVEAAFDEAEHKSQIQGAHVRALALLVIGGWLVFENMTLVVVYYHVILLVFVLLGYAPVILRRKKLWQPWQRYVVITLDMLLIAYTILVPNPFFDGILPAAQQLKWSNEVYVFILIAASVFSYSPKAVVWTGVMGAIAWTLGFLWILDQPGSYLAGMTPDMIEWAPDKLSAFVGDPARLDYVVHAKVVMLFVLVSVVLAIAMVRVRDLVRRQTVAERERANLARYFSPTWSTSSPNRMNRSAQCAPKTSPSCLLTSSALPRRARRRAPSR